MPSRRSTGTGRRVSPPPLFALGTRAADARQAGVMGRDHASSSDAHHDAVTASSTISDSRIVNRAVRTACRRQTKVQCLAMLAARD